MSAKPYLAVTALASLAALALAACASAAAPAEPTVPTASSPAPAPAPAAGGGGAGGAGDRGHTDVAADDEMHLELVRSAESHLRACDRPAPAVDLDGPSDQPLPSAEPPAVDESCDPAVAAEKLQQALASYVTARDQRAAEVVHVETANGTTQPPAATPAPWYRQWWVWAAIGGVAAGATGAVLYTTMAGSDAGDIGGLVSVQ
jgi:hypothetical protein